MAVVPIISQSWDTTSYVNPTRMNNIETNISTLSKATGIEYSAGVSVKDKIDSKADLTAVPFRQIITITSLSSITESGIYRINNTDDDANKPEALVGKTCFIIAFTYGLKTLFIRPYYPWEASYAFFVANTSENGVVERTTWRRITTTTS